MGLGQTVQAVVFDLDGLLLDTERVYLKAYRRVCNSLGNQAGEGSYLDLMGLNSNDLSSALQDRLGSKTGANSFICKWNREIAAIFETDVPVKDGAYEICDFLAKSEIPGAVATSSDSIKALDRLSRAGLGEYFPVLVGGDQIERGKPAPDTYLEAARRLGTDPKKTVAFEDSDIGVRAALAAGMITVQVPDIQQPSEQVRRCGHLIAPDILTAARELGLMP